MDLRLALSDLWTSFSFVGLATATVFFALSVTPSLLPRPALVQGLLSGFSLAIGYGLGVLFVWVWLWLELKRPSPALQWWSKRLTSVGVAIVFVTFVWRSTVWQNSIRELVGLDPIQTADPILFVSVAIGLGLVLVLLVRRLIALGGWLASQLSPILPRRLSRLIGGVTVVMLTILVANGVIARGLLAAADQFFSGADALTDAGIAMPTESNATGSLDSLINWESIGRRGKQFLVDGPDADSITDITGRPAKQPIRVYAGMRSGDDVDQRAALALAELKRVGGFDRSVLVVATPTGTGWLDPGGVDTIEVLHDGDTAIVSTQYSYLPSWITILVEPSEAKRSAAALFDAVYEHWKTLSPKTRPRLVLFGLSLGAFGGEMAADLLTTFEDPIDGAVWAGTPFPSTRWKQIVADRNEDSPAWLPTFRDSRMVRFTNQTNHLETGTAWGPIRNVYVQYASDPMVWFSPSLAWKRPDWLTGTRGPDVSEFLQWVPIVTFLQIAFDLPLATSVPIGHGHNYNASSYIDAWFAVTQPDHWDAESMVRLKSVFAAKEDL
ncbi:MAG: alpha/beta-hydrolase family protein [Planctomycetota bacterium]